MPQEGYKSIQVTDSVWEKLKQKKLKAQAKMGKDITWDDFLMGVVDSMKNKVKIEMSKEDIQAIITHKHKWIKKWTGFIWRIECEKCGVVKGQ